MDARPGSTRAADRAAGCRSRAGARAATVGEGATWGSLLATPVIVKDPDARTRPPSWNDGLLGLVPLARRMLSDIHRRQLGRKPTAVAGWRPTCGGAGSWLRSNRWKATGFHVLTSLECRGLVFLHSFPLRAAVFRAREAHGPPARARIGAAREGIWRPRFVCARAAAGAGCPGCWGLFVVGETGKRWRVRGQRRAETHAHFPSNGRADGQPAGAGHARQPSREAHRVRKVAHLLLPGDPQSRDSRSCSTSSCGPRFMTLPERELLGRTHYTVGLINWSTLPPCHPAAC